MTIHHQAPTTNPTVHQIKRSSQKPKQTSSHSTAGIIGLQRSAGNRAVASLLAGRSIQRSGEEAPPGVRDPVKAPDPIVESEYPDYSWNTVTTTQSGPTYPNIRTIAAAATKAGDVSGASINPVHRAHGSFYPTYYSLRNAVGGVVARVSWLDAGMTDEGTTPEGQPIYGFLWRPSAFARAGSLQPSGLPKQDSKGSQTPTAKQIRAAITAVGDVGSDFTPVVSNIKDATIAVVGINPVTGERVGVAGRVASAIFAIPILGNAMKWLSKGGKLAGRALRWLGRTRLARWAIGKAGKIWGRIGGRTSRALLRSQRHAAKEMVAKLREKAGKVVVNIGGTGAKHEPVHAINMNPNVVASRKEIPNLIQERAERMADVFEPGAVDEVVGYGLPHDTLNWSEVATGASTTLSTGGKVSIQLRWAHPEEAAKMLEAFSKAGFKDVHVFKDAVLTATK